jgi:hypothetical protein
MAENDIILIRRNGDGVWQEIVLNSTADYVLGFNGDGDVVAKPLPALSAHQGTHRAGGSDPLPWGSLIHASGLIGARPAAAAANAGYYYFATDSDGGTLFRSDGATWTAQTIGKSKTAILDAIQAFTGTNTFDDVVLGGTILVNAGGNARGVGAIDLQRNPTAVTEVASGDYSFLIQGEGNTASGIGSGVIGGGYSTASGGNSLVLGALTATASGDGSVVVGGLYGVSHLFGQVSAGAGFDRNHTISVSAITDTANATPKELLGLGSGRITIPSGQTWGFVATIVGRQSGGVNKALYRRQGLISNTGGTTALDAAVQSIGTDIETDAAWDCAITADNANSALVITVTGAAATNIRWLATLELTQVTYT